MKLQELFCRHKNTYKAISNDREWGAEQTICLNCGKVLLRNVSQYQKDKVFQLWEDYAEPNWTFYVDWYLFFSFGTFKTVKKVKFREE